MAKVSKLFTTFGWMCNNKNTGITSGGVNRKLLNMFFALMFVSVEKASSRIPPERNALKC